jgi:hypothetical protein
MRNPSNIYVNSTHDNPDREAVVSALKAIDGFLVADPWSAFPEKPPMPDEGALDDSPHAGDIAEFTIAVEEAVVWCDAMIVIAPVDTQVAAALGMAHGCQKPIYVLMLSSQKPDLSFAMADAVCTSISEAMLLVDGRDPVDDEQTEDAA